MSDMANAPAFTTHLITVDEYHRMAEGGVFDPDTRIELIDGELIERMSPANPPHASTIDRITRRFYSAFSDLATIRIQSPITLGPLSEPEPDLALVAKDAHEYERHHPGIEDVFLVVEVSDSTLASDRRKKMPFYARQHVTEVWLIDLVHMCLHVYRDPKAGTYSNVRRFERGERVATLAFPTVVLEVAELLPKFIDVS